MAAANANSKTKVDLDTGEAASRGNIMAFEAPETSVIGGLTVILALVGQAILLVRRIERLVSRVDASEERIAEQRKDVEKLRDRVDTHSADMAKAMTEIRSVTGELKSEISGMKATLTMIVQMFGNHRNLNP
jgi:uncharacterized coiled-coil protein SlyX